MAGSIPGLAHLAPIIKATHERWDGRGYPEGLSGEEIPLGSRIVHACEAWHAMTSDRPYREALGREALDELHKNMGKQFDPRVALTLAEVVKVLHLLTPAERERMITKALFRAGAAGYRAPEGWGSAPPAIRLRSFAGFLGEREEAESSGAGTQTALDTERPEPRIPLSQPPLYLLCYNSASSTREVNYGKSR